MELIERLRFDSATSRYTQRLRRAIQKLVLDELMVAWDAACEGGAWHYCSLPATELTLGVRTRAGMAFRSMLWMRRSECRRGDVSYVGRWRRTAQTEFSFAGGFRYPTAEMSYY